MIPLEDLEARLVALCPPELRRLYHQDLGAWRVAMVEFLSRACDIQAAALEAELAGLDLEDPAAAARSRVIVKELSRLFVVMGQDS